jgi:gliding motility-associated-like protein
MHLRIYIVYTFIFISFHQIYGQVLITEETFDEPSGSITGIMSNGEPWDATLFNDCTGGGIWSVQNGQFVVQAMEGFNCCECFPGGGGTGCGDSGNTITLGPIDITGFIGITIDFDFRAFGDMECAYFDFPPFQDCPENPGPLCNGGNDQAIFSYSIDGQPEEIFAYWCGDQFCFGTDLACIPNIGNSLTVTIKAGTQATNESYRIDNIQVFGITQTSVIAEANGNNNSDGPVSLCFGDSLQLNEVAGQADAWRWSGPDNFSSFSRAPFFPNVGTENSGTYIVTAQDEQGCDYADTIEILVADPILLVDPMIGTINVEEAVDFDLTQFNDVVNGGSGETVTWYDGNPNSSGTEITNPSSVDLNDLDLWVLVGDTGNCFVAESVFFEVFIPIRVFIPTVFSPNGDGINDIFKLYSDQDIFIKRIEIFNRWGNKVFVRENLRNSVFDGWNGLLDGKQAQEGVYSYFLEAQFTGGSTELFKGALTIIR